MKFAFVVSALGSLIFALAVAGVYELSHGPLAVATTWALKVAIGMFNIRIGHWKRSKDDDALEKLVAEGV